MVAEHIAQLKTISIGFGITSLNDTLLIVVNGRVF